MTAFFTGQDCIPSRSFGMITVPLCLEYIFTVAVAEVSGPGAGLAVVDQLDLVDYHLFHATRADLLARLDRRAEAAAAYDNGKIQITSPLAQGLLGRKVGEKVEIQVPAGMMKFHILEIRFDEE